MITNRYYGLNLFRQIMHVMCKLKFPKCICRYLNIKRHEYILKKLDPYFKIAQNHTFNITKKQYYNSHIIWIFWWQGLNNMPQLVKLCIKSIRNHYMSNKVVLITKYNINCYIKLPKYIWNRLEDNDIHLAHFSDIVRFKLLRQYGGLWLDSTVFCTSNINYYCFDYLYTSYGGNNSYRYYVSTKWTSFLIGGCSENNLFKFIDEFYRIYWSTHYFIIDYFMLDYALYYAYLHNIGNFGYYVDNKAFSNNRHITSLMGLLNEPFNNLLFNKIIKDTNLFKLTYKKKWKNTGNTFYSKIMNNNSH